MKLDIKEKRITKNELRYEISPAMGKVNLQVNMKNQIKLFGKTGPGPVGAVVSKIMVGSPLEPLYLFVEQVTIFANTDEGDTELKMDKDEITSLFNTICVPMAMREVEESIKKLCNVCNIPEISLHKNNGKPKSPGSYLN